jgi:AraC-like DNA-binding protein/mannose-6-phosphate isomerase-like protein (cupin superfamily)
MDPWAPSDPLGEALYSVRMDGAFYALSELTAPWGVTLPPMEDYVWFHVVTAGALLLEAGDGGRIEMHRGDLALVPHGTGHVLRSEPGVPAPGILELEREEVSPRYEIVRHGGGGAYTGLICGAVRLGHPAARRLVAALPPVLLLEAEQTLGTGWMDGTLRLMAAEARELRPGGEAVITRLADILVIQTLRTWIERDPAARQGWLGALRDRHVGRALALMHREPARDWTVDELADELAMSRSAFAARFTALVGEPAMQYLTRWRMHLALDQLAGGDATVAELADRLGYRSEAAFARAFKRGIGSPPGAVRRRGVDLGMTLASAA